MASKRKRRPHSKSVSPMLEAIILIPAGLVIAAVVAAALLALVAATTITASLAVALMIGTSTALIAAVIGIVFRPRGDAANSTQVR